MATLASINIFMISIIFLLGEFNEDKQEKINTFESRLLASMFNSNYSLHDFCVDGKRQGSDRVYS